jgi:hypothetical protein
MFDEGGWMEKSGRHGSGRRYTSIPRDPGIKNRFSDFSSDRESLHDPGGSLSSVGLDSALQKPSAGILVHQSPQQVRLYLFSLNIRISEVIIHKNAEPGRNNYGSSGGNK